MKSRSILVGLAVIALVSGCASSGGSKYGSPSEWVQHSKSGPYLVLADKADVWSEAKPFGPNSGQMTVQSKFIRHFGTTCEFHVQFNNTSSRAVDVNTKLDGADKVAVVSTDHLTRVKLNPGASAAFGMEMRECPLQWGESKDMGKCAACEPVLFYVK